MFVLGRTPSFFVLLCLASFYGFFGTRPTPFWYSPKPLFNTCPNLFPVLARTLLQYSPEFDPFPVLARIQPFSGTLPDPFPVLTWILILSRYSPRYFFSTCLDPSSVLTRILSLFGTRQDMISSPTSCLDFLGFSGTCPDLIHFPLVYSSIVSESPNNFKHSVQFPLVFSGIVFKFL